MAYNRAEKAYMSEGMFLCYYVAYRIESGKAVTVKCREVHAFHKVHVFEVYDKSDKQHPYHVIFRCV